MRLTILRKWTRTGNLYATTLETLIQGWENKGWAIREKSKQALANRRAQLSGLRQKINRVGLIRPEKG